ncbi:sodium:solute symporter [Asticcacaulis sp.]|uniref:sodium:solute symporter n=1 Tax=Asticcacaulis sp. TaxID=1872648 RepID=UPI002BE6A03A|nr:sodium:solute symporter [Asticcacaulis sp.]HTM81526.1 sodium:solute symporter [Asticcacaulis sp.]
MTPSMRVPALDLGIIIAYIIAILLVGILAARSKTVTGKVFFLAGRSLPWGIVGTALFASNISTIHLVGLSASGYKDGLVWGNFEWMAAFTLILLSLIFAPFYFRSGISTLPEFLERRYSSASRSVLAIMAIMAALFIHIGMSLYAGAIVFEQFFGIRVEISIIIVSVIISIYTILGGLKAVVVTETFNTAVLLAGVFLITGFAIMALPSHGIHTLADFKAAVKPDQLHVIQTHSTAGLNWYAVFLGYPILGIWYWCTDQTIVQRVLGAKSERDAQLGPLLAGFLKLLPMFVLILPGVIAYVLFKDKIGENANDTLPVLINTLIPTGLRGLICAAVLAALMSAVSAALNSCGTLVAVDIVKRLKPDISDRRLVNTGRVASAVVMVLAILWSTQGGRFSSIFEAINVIASDLAPPITTVFLFGVFWKRGTKEASLVTLLAGMAMGITAFLFDLPVIGTTRVLTDEWGIPFLMQAWWMFCICSVIFIIVSLVTPKPEARNIEGLTWTNPWAVLSGPVSSVTDPRCIAGLLFATMIVFYVIFR